MLLSARVSQPVLSGNPLLVWAGPCNAGFLGSAPCRRRERESTRTWRTTPRRKSWCRRLGLGRTTSSSTSHRHPPLPQRTCKRVPASRPQNFCFCLHLGQSCDSLPLSLCASAVGGGGPQPSAPCPCACACDGTLHHARKRKRKPNEDENEERKPKKLETENTSQRDEREKKGEKREPGAGEGMSDERPSDSDSLVCVSVSAAGGGGGDC